MKKLLFLFFITLMSATIIFAQEYQVFNSDNSDLPYNQIYCIEFDNDGNIWFGGQKDATTGIANVSMLSSDLSTWTVYDQSDLGLGNMEDRVFYMAVDDQNNKWFCTHYGASVLRSDGTAEEVDFLVDDYTRTVMTDSEGNVYISNRTDGGIWYSDDYGANWTMWAREDIGMTAGRAEIYDLREDSQGQLWICTWYGVTYRDTGGTWHVIEELDQDYTYAMDIDSEDNKWIVMHVYDGGDFPDKLLKLDAEGNFTEIDSTVIPLFSSIIWDIEVDVNDHVWCSTGGEGIVEILPDGSYNQYTMASTGGELKQDIIYDLEIYDNVIWAAFADSGIVRIDGLITGDTKVDYDSEITNVPDDFQLSQNYPNPFNPTTTIRFDLHKSSTIQLSVYGIKGELIDVIASGNYTAGSHFADWDAKDMAGNAVSSGVYIYQLKDGQNIISKKMTLIR